MEDKPTALDSTKNAIEAALNGGGNSAPAEQPAPTVDAPASPEEKTVSEAEAVIAAKQPEPKADEPAKTPEPEPEEDIDEVLNQRELKIPAYRLKKKADQAKKAETEAEQLRRENAEKDAKIAALEAKKQSGDDDGNDDDEVLTAAGEKAIREQGYAKKDEILAEVRAELAETAERDALKSKVRQDMVQLSSWTKENGYPPFKPSEILTYAEETMGSDALASGDALKAAYMLKHSDAIREADVKAALAKQDKLPTAEKSGGSAGVPAAAGASSSGSWRDRVSEVIDSSN